MFTETVADSVEVIQTDEVVQIVVRDLLGCFTVRHTSGKDATEKEKDQRRELDEGDFLLWKFFLLTGKEPFSKAFSGNFHLSEVDFRPYSASFPCTGLLGS